MIASENGLIYLFVVRKNFCVDIFLTAYAKYIGRLPIWRPFPKCSVYGYACAPDAYREKLIAEMRRSWLSRLFFAAPTAIVCGLTSNLGHYIWNEWCGLQTAQMLGLISPTTPRLPCEGDFLGIAGKTIKASEFPIVYGGRLLYYSSLFVTEAHRSVFREKYPLTRLSKPARKIVCIQIRTNQRNFLKKQEHIIFAIKELSKEFPDICYVIDGHSLTDAILTPDESLLNRENEVFKSIARDLPSDIRIINIIGDQLRNKIPTYELCDLFIGSIGSGGVIPCWMLKKPAVMYGPPWMYKWVREQEARVPEDGPFARFVESWETTDGFDFDRLELLNMCRLVLSI